MSRRDVTSSTETHGDVVTAISNGTVVLLKEFYGRGPTRAKTYYLQGIDNAEIIDTSTRDAHRWIPVSASLRL